MTDALLMVIVPGVTLIALGVDLAVSWMRRRWR
jgi:hypothetical protein